MKDLKLCLIDGCWAFFTTAPIDKQWGDDWNDTPYEHNAGHPYEDDCQILQVAFRGDLYPPCSDHLNSPWCVRDINEGSTPWLRGDRWSKHKVKIMAGTTVKEFCRLVKEASGQVYLPDNIGQIV